MCHELHVIYVVELTENIYIYATMYLKVKSPVVSVIPHAICLAHVQYVIFPHERSKESEITSKALHDSLNK